MLLLHPASSQAIIFHNALKTYTTHSYRRPMNPSYPSREGARPQGARQTYSKKPIIATDNVHAVIDPRNIPEHILVPRPKDVYEDPTKTTARHLSISLTRL